MRQRIKRIVPRPLRVLKSKIELYGVDRQSVDARPLAEVNRVEPEAFLHSKVVQKELASIEKQTPARDENGFAYDEFGSDGEK